jgi:hypothetical protein
VRPNYACSEDAHQPNLDVTLTSAEQDFVLGQIVKLNLEVRNLEDKHVPAWELNDIPNVGIWISSDGRQYLPYNNLLGADLVNRPLIWLKPDESLRCRIEILVSRGRDAEFAFRDGPGPYWIKARYNLTRPKLPGYSYDTEPVQIKVTPPQGDDETVLTGIQDIQFLRYLQFGGYFPDRPDLPVKALELLEKFPNCAYHIDLRSRVMRAYLSGHFRTQGKIWQSELLARAEKVLGINSKTFYSYRVLPHEDFRLDRMVQYEYSKPTDLQQVFEDLTRKGGVPLKLHNDLKQSSYQSGLRIVALRHFMQSVIEPDHTTCVRSGHAYILQPVKMEESP